MHALSLTEDHLSLPRASGDSRWFRAFYDAHVAFVRRVVVRLAGPVADVDDLHQSIFLVAHRRWPELSGQVDPRSWLYGVALRVVSESRRRHRFRRFLGLEAAPELASPDTASSALEQREARERVYRLLDGLSEKKRAVLLLFELEELSGEAIAEILGCPLQTVWSRLSHARKDFEKALARDEARVRRELEGGVA